MVFEGWDAAGKGTTIKKLTQQLEPRGFTLYAIHGPRTYELHMPWLWRFWLKTPSYGEIGIFDRSWYGRVLIERVEGLTKETDWRRAYQEIVEYERLLAEDRYVVAKFFLHISKEEQRQRLESLSSDEATHWQVAQEDWDHNERYGEYREAVEAMLERTDSEWAPWTVVEATDKRWARVKVFQTLVSCLEEGLSRSGLEVPKLKESEGWEADEEAD